jgi:PHP family Zn ribbon phosphoesterase
MAAEDVVMMDNDVSWLSSSISTESSLSSSPSSSSLTEHSSSSSTDLPKLTVNKTVSNKRKLMLDIKGYHFQLKDYSKDQTKKFWRCANRGCRVIVHTTIEDTFIRYGGKSSIHSHLPNPSASEVRNLREVMRKRAENETTSLQIIAEQEVRQALLTGEALAVLPRINRLGMILIFLST